MHRVRNTIFLALLGSALVFLFAKVKATKEHSILDDIEIPSAISSQPDSVIDSIALSNLVSAIATLGYLEEGYVGIEGRKSTQPNYLEYLKKWADTFQLIKLTDHGNPLVRSFAFQALKENKFTGLKKIFDKHLNDKQTYNVHSGCTIEPFPVNIAYYYCISPTLTSAEKASYKKKLLEIYKGTYFEFMISWS